MKPKTGWIFSMLLLAACWLLATHGNRPVQAAEISVPPLTQQTTATHR